MATPNNGTFSSIHSAPSHRISMLDVFMPGFSLVSVAAEQLFTGELNRYAYLACVVGMVPFLSGCTHRLVSRLEPYLTSTIHIKRSDEVYDMLSAWISAHQLGEAARSSLALVAKKQGSEDGNSSSSKKCLDFIPWEGSFWFWHNHHLISYRTELQDHGFHKEEHISLTCWSRSSQALKEFLNECREEYLTRIQSRTTIFENCGDRWKRVGSKSIRPLSTVILDEREKQPLVKDIESFLGPANRAWYSRKALPYRRGYLLSGPPGTGKSSLSMSVAGEFDLDIYVVSISDTTDANLKDLFSQLPGKCAVLLEDIDAAGVSLSRESDSEDSDDERGPRRQKTGVTMSGLLNTLDGVASQEGRIVIMTTNHAEKLDEALIRPGRVDVRVDFQLADKAVIMELFNFILDESMTEAAENQSKGVSDRDSVIAKQAAAFASKVPQLTFSQAEIMSYLLQHRNFPARAVEHAEKWVKDLLTKKRALKRENFWGSCT